MAVVDLCGALELTFLLPRHTAARIRRQAAELLCKYLGGDLSLVGEVCTLRGFQEELALHAPEDPRRLFGDVVEGGHVLPFISFVNGINQTCHSAH